MIEPCILIWRLHTHAQVCAQPLTACTIRLPQIEKIPVTNSIISKDYYFTWAGNPAAGGLRLEQALKNATKHPNSLSFSVPLTLTIVILLAVLHAVTALCGETEILSLFMLEEQWQRREASLGFREYCLFHVTDWDGAGQCLRAMSHHATGKAGDLGFLASA